MKSRHRLSRGVDAALLIAALCVSGCASSGSQKAQPQKTQGHGLYDLTSPILAYRLEHRRWPSSRDELAEERPGFSRANYSELIFLPAEDDTLTVYFVLPHEPQFVQELHFDKQDIR